MSKESGDGLSQHIADLQKQISAIDKHVMPTLEKNAEKARRAYESSDPKNDPMYPIYALQYEVVDQSVATLYLAKVTLQEFVQVWEQHKLLSDYFEQKLSSEEFAELRAKMDAVLAHKHALRFIDFLINQHKEETEKNDESGS